MYHRFDVDLLSLAPFVAGLRLSGRSYDRTLLDVWFRIEKLLSWLRFASIRIVWHYLVAFGVASSEEVLFASMLIFRAIGFAVR
jgi:hypothetical protein